MLGGMEHSYGSELNSAATPRLVFNLQRAAEPVAWFKNEPASSEVDLNVCVNRSKRERKLICLL